jgi:hypothetical protein
MGEHDQPIAIAALALPDHDRVAVVDLLHRYRRHRPIVIPGDQPRHRRRDPLPPSAEVHRVVTVTEPAAGNELPSTGAE